MRTAISGRYNLVDGELAAAIDVGITTFNLAGGWFMTKNVLAKFEYVNQEYNGFSATDIRNGGQFKY